MANLGKIPSSLTNLTEMFPHENIRELCVSYEHANRHEVDFPPEHRTFIDDNKTSYVYCDGTEMTSFPPFIYWYVPETYVANVVETLKQLRFKVEMTPYHKRNRWLNTIETINKPHPWDD